MALNNFGLGMELTAKDSASAALVGLGKNLSLLKRQAEDANQAFEKTTSRTRDLTTGRFVSAPKGVLDPSFLGEVSGKMKEVAAGMTIAAGAIVAGLGYASEKAEEFNKAIALVATEADLALFPQQKMKDIAIDLGKQFGQLPTKEAEAMYKAVALGANTAAKAQDLLTGANLLAVAGDSDLSLTMNALGGALNAYGMDMSHATEFSDAMFTAMKNGNTTVQDLAGSIGRVTASTSNLGVSFDETMSAISVMTNKGVGASEAVSGLQEALMNVVHPSAQAAAEAARLGIKFNQTELRAKGLQGFMKEITSSAKFNANSMSQLFTSAMGANAAIQITSGSMEAFNATMGEMSKKQGATTAGFDIMSETSAFQKKQFDALVNTALILIGDGIEPLKASVMKAANVMITWFTKLSKPVIRMVTYFAAGTAAVLAFLGGAIGVGLAIGGLVVAAKAIAVGLGLAVIGLVAFAAAMAPIIGLAVTVYEIWTNNIGGVATSVKAWLGTIVLAFKAVGQAISEGGFSGAVLEELNKAENSGVKQFAINVFMWFARIKNFALGVWEGFQSGLGRVSPIIEKIVNAFHRLWARFAPVQEAVGSARSTFESFGKAGGTTGDFLATIVEKISTGILGMINFIDGAVEAYQKMKPALSAAWDAIKGIIGAFGVLFSAQSTGSGSAQDTADLWRTIGNVIGVVATVMVGTLVTAFQLVGGIVQWVMSIVGAMQDLFQGMANGLVIGVELIYALMTGKWGEAFKFAQEFVENWATTVLKMLASIVGGAAGMVDALGKVFGKDIGLKAKVEGIASPLAGPAAALSAPGVASPVAASANLTSGAPGVAAAGPLAPQAVNAPVVVPAPTLNATLKSTIQLDGRVVAEVNKKVGQEESSRGYGSHASSEG